jgi:signal transduction histidine kinase
VDLMACFIVRDTGSGLSDETLSRIFDPFRQGDGSDSRRHQGLGLGLATVKRVVEGLGGSITVSSAPGEGATFAFAVPLAKSPIQAPVSG